MIIDPASAPVSAENGVLTLHLSVAGGLTQFGAYLQTLQPGAVSSDRHWHDSEDEFLLVLDGTVTLRDDDGSHDLTAGDVACWPHGCPNAHHLTNLGSDACRYLIVGSRVALDVCHYSETGRLQVNGQTRWQVLEADGSVVREGDLPAELLSLAPVWGVPFDPANPGNRVLRVADQTVVEAADTPHPVLGAGLGPYAYRLLSDPGGLSQFGAFVEVLPPGSRSSHRHWHAGEDEMAYVLSGAVVLVEDAETVLQPGDAVAWPAGAAIGHQLCNRSDGPASYLVIGTRKPDDIIHYPDHDLITHKTGPVRRYLRRDGSAYPPRREE